MFRFSASSKMAPARGCSLFFSVDAAYCKRIVSSCVDVYKRQIAHGSLRLSLSDENTPEEMDEIVEKLKKIVARLREMSPVWEEIQKREGKRG